MILKIKEDCQIELKARKENGRFHKKRKLVGTITNSIL